LEEGLRANIRVALAPLAQQGFSEVPFGDGASLEELLVHFWESLVERCGVFG
jgi:hypothetical protein